MQANWSLILNILLLIGVVFAIARMMRARRQHSKWVNHQSISTAQPMAVPQDDIIAVRKVNRDVLGEQSNSVQVSVRPHLQTTRQSTSPSLGEVAEVTEVAPVANPVENKERLPSSIVMFLLAKGDRQFAGYELLQTVLAAGLRFGEGDLFHRHQSPNGQGPVLFSLATATATGVFDMQNIGGFSVRGLCLFMQASGSPTIDEERFAILLDTAKQLRDGLDAYLLDDQRQNLSQSSIERYSRLLSLESSCELAS